MRFWLLLFWMVATILLTFSVVGMLLFITPDDYSRSTWMEIGKDLIDEYLNKELIFILFILWSLFSILLACSVIGLFLFIPRYPL